MKKETTRRGHTQTQNDVVVQNKKGHSQKSLLGISLIRFWKEGPRQLFKQTNGQKGDPRQHSSGMTTNFDTPSPVLRTSSPSREKKSFPMRRFVRGFTLIELLVVVLIIGILAAVALPQYQKAVEKTRIANALTVMSSIQKSIDVWLLENGYPTSGTDYFFLWTDLFTENADNSKVNATIEIRNALDCANNSPFGDLCTDGNFGYEAMCSSYLCYVSAYKSYAAYNGEGDYSLNMARHASTNTWEYECYYYDASGERACNTLKGQGNWQIVDGNE